MFDALFTSIVVVAIAEIGDKTQLLAVMLSCRFRRPLPIIAGIFVATIVNHLLAALVGAELARMLAGRWFSIAVGLSFLAMALWALIPDRMTEDDDAQQRSGSVFLATLIAFFLVEMGDKTQIATVALGARFHDVLWVAAGTTLGMMLANVPAVYLGDALIQRVPLRLVRMASALVFAALGLAILLDHGGGLLPKF